MWAAVRLVRASWLFGWIFASYMLQLGLTKVFGRARMRRRLAVVHRRNARRLYRGFVRLRGVYIKLGQILSIMGNFLPKVYADELERLQDEVPPRRFRLIARSVTRSLGKPPLEAFEHFSQEPIAAASLGQVHQATTHEGDRVAVKVLYPNVATIIKVDLRVLGWALKVYQRFVPVQQIERVHEQLTDMLQRETDYANEARCLERMAANFADDPDVLFPRVFHPLSTDRVLTMSFMEGVKITKLGALRAAGPRSLRRGHASWSRCSTSSSSSTSSSTPTRTRGTSSSSAVPRVRCAWSSSISARPARSRTISPTACSTSSPG